MNTKLLSRLSQSVKLSLFCVFAVIIAGGIVRSTGSGMGCPDWPKCFEKWVPPTSISQIPENYKEIYIEKRRQKNFKLARYLSLAGMNDLASRISNDPSIYEETEFKPIKTWIEYINRLFGAVLGFVLFGVLYFSYKIRREKPVVYIISMITVILTGFQGWLGSLVVSTNLLPLMITVHMLLALVIVALLINLYILSLPENKSIVAHKRNVPGFLPILMIFLTLVQILSGTDVRQHIDAAAIQYNYEFRELWIDSIGNDFLFHRSFSWLIIITNLAFVFLVFRKKNNNDELKKPAIWLSAFILLEISIGITMAYFDIPAWAQPLHLTLASLIFAAQYYLAVKVISPSKVISN